MGLNEVAVMDAAIFEAVMSHSPKTKYANHRGFPRIILLQIFIDV